MEHNEPKTGRTLPIRIDEVYTLAEFQQRTGLGRNGIRAARRRGLPVRQCGRNKYVTGSDWAGFLREVGTTESRDR